MLLSCQANRSLLNKFNSLFFLLHKGRVTQGVDRYMMIMPLNCSPYGAISSFYVRKDPRLLFYEMYVKFPAYISFYGFAGRNPHIILRL